MRPVRRRTGPALAALAALALAGCADKAPEQKSTPPTLITVTQAVAQPFEVVETTLGTLEAVQDPRIAAEVAGRVVRIAVRPGQAVRQGELLAEIDPADTVQQHRAERAEVARLEALLAQQERLVARQRELLDRNFISRNALDDASAQRDALAGQLDAARARAALAEANLRKTRIVAPFDGVVEEQIAARGDYLKLGDPAFRLVSNAQLRARLPFPESTAPRLKPGQKVRLASPLQPGRVFEGVVDEIRPALTETSRALDVIVRIDNADAALRSGGSLDAAVVLGVRQAAVMVPEQSVVLRPAGRVVYIVTDGRARQRVVEVGGKAAGMVEILSGIAGGETVALDGAGFLSDGAEVELRQRDGAAPPAPARDAAGKP